MSWIKLDDQWMDHPKIIKVGRDARDVWLASITWCAKHLTDGYFPVELLPSLATMAGIDQANVKQIAEVLLDVCLWEFVDGRYLIHDYLEYNPTKEQTAANRMARSEAGKIGGGISASKRSSKIQAKGQAKFKQNSTPSPSPSPSPSPNPVPGPEPKDNAATAAPAAKKPPERDLSLGQKMFLGHFGAIRFKNIIQKDIIASLEEKYGFDRLKECTDWAAKRGMSVGEAIPAIEKAIQNWGTSPPKPNNHHPPGNSTLDRSLAAVQEVLAQEEIRNGDKT